MALLIPLISVHGILLCHSHKVQLCGWHNAFACCYKIGLLTFLPVWTHLNMQPRSPRTRIIVHSSKDTQGSFRSCRIYSSRVHVFAGRIMRSNDAVSWGERKARVSRAFTSGRIALNSRIFPHGGLWGCVWRGIPFICFQVTGHTRYMWACICQGKGDTVGTISTIIHNGSRTPAVRRTPTTIDQVSRSFISSFVTP